jgi:hypothetical protein
MLKLSKYAALIGTGALLCAPAFAIPGPSVSYGANPIWSVGGDLNIISSDSVTLNVAQTGQELIITDLVFTVATSEFSCMVLGTVELSDSTSTLASYSVRAARYGEGQADSAISMNSGIRVQEGESLVVSTANIWESSCSTTATRVHYSLSGYYAEP